MARDTGNPVTYEQWPGGVNNRLRETEQRSGRRSDIDEFVRSAVNIDFTASGTPLRRAGYARVQSGDYHSLWADPALPFALVVKNNNLTLLRGVEPLETTLQAVQPGNLVSYAFLNNTVYWSNGAQTGRVALDGTVLPWGLPVPPQPALTPIADRGMAEGCYRVTVSYVDVDGVEHGACESVRANVAANGGLTVTAGGPFPDRAAYAEIFVTRAGGETFYAAARLTAPGTVTLGASDIGVGRPVETMFKEAPFPGQLVCEFSGRLYIAVDNALFFTDPLRYELITPETNVILFPSTIQLLAPSHDGLYVGYTSAIDFLAGTDPFDMQRRLVASSAAVLGTSTQIPGRFFDLALDFVPIWWMQGDGFALGLPGGEVRYLTSDRLATQEFGAGAIMAYEREGMTQVLSALRQPGGGAAAATDSVVATVRQSNLD